MKTTTPDTLTCHCGHNGPDVIPTHGCDAICVNCRASRDVEEVASMRVYRCRECGGANVQHAMWVCLNTDKTRDAFGSWCHGDNSWCDDCDDHTEIEEDSVELTRDQIPT